MATDNPDYKAVLEVIGIYLTSFLEEGKVQLPVFSTMVGTNGAFMHGCFTETPQAGLYKFERCGTHDIDGGLQAPIHVLLIDTKGKDATLTIKSPSPVLH